MPQLTTRLLLVSVAVVISMVLGSAATALAAQRTFVSGNGSDADPCLINSPCRSFDAALLQTDANGEIIALDSAGYGAVVVSKSVSIIAPPGVYAGITAFPTSPNGNGITIGGNSKVVLRGLSINGQGGTNGIHVFGNAVVHIENCVVSNLFNNGIHVSGLIGSPKVFIGGTTVRDNGNDGIYVSGSATVHVDHVRSERNGGSGVYVVDGPLVTVSFGVIAGNDFNGVRAHSSNGVSTTTVTIDDSTVSGNGSTGVYGDAWAAGNLTRIRTARSTITLNSTGVAAESLNGGSVVATVSENLLTDNVSGSGIVAYGGNATLTASSNSVSGGAVGLRQAFGALFRTRSNNVVQDNATDVSGTTTFVAGD